MPNPVVLSEEASAVSLPVEVRYSRSRIPRGGPPMLRRRSQGNPHRDRDKVIIGQAAVDRGAAGRPVRAGHCLLVGVPGLAKTLLIQHARQNLSSAFQPHPVHARPDALRHHRHRGHRGGPTTGPAAVPLRQGPVFANMVLADEINRTPPKTQAALLEAMQEHQVTAAGRTHELPEPFFVLATQNPIEQEGTYPLPEAQLDRFMFMITSTIRARTRSWRLSGCRPGPQPAAGPRADAGAILQLQDLVRGVPVADHVVRYALAVARRPADLADRPGVAATWPGAGPAGHPVPDPRGQGPGDPDRPHPGIDRRRHGRRPPHAPPPADLDYRAEAEGVRPGDLVDRLLGEIAPSTAT